MNAAPVAPRREFWTAYAAGFVALTALYAAIFAATGAAAGLAARGAAAAMLPSALFGVAPIRLVGRLPWRVERRGVFFVGHGVWLLGVTVLATATWQGLRTVDVWLQRSDLRSSWQMVVWQGLVNGLLQLALWRSQLNPNFVLNTLHALIGLVGRDPARAEAALERLGELLRFGLHVQQSGLDHVVFREEWAFVASSIALEDLRLGERLRLALHAGEEVMDVPVPPFALQPLVENAIAHAIAPRREGGRLEVRATREGERLNVLVEDDGPGASEAAVLASPRLGLRLLRDRLSTLYGGEARLAFEPAAGGGLRVRLDLPAGGVGPA